MVYSGSCLSEIRAVILDTTASSSRKRALSPVVIVGCSTEIILDTEEFMDFAQDFGRLLRKHEGLVRLEQWKAAVRSSGIAELIAFVELVG
jgi:hypothetical protein